MKRLCLLLALLLFAAAAAAESPVSQWIPEGAIYESALETDGMRMETYLLPETGERLTLTLNGETGASLTLSGTTESIPSGEAPDRAMGEAAVAAAYPGALVISVSTETMDGAQVMRLCLLSEEFSGYVLFAGEDIIGRELSFAQCIRDGMISMQGAVAALRLLRPEAALVDIELDDDDGILLYEGEALVSGVEYEFELDAYTGRLLQWSRPG